VARWRESLRFHVPLIEPDVRISPGAPGLSEKDLAAIGSRNFHFFAKLPDGFRIA
jgi:hypothetical protein